MALFGETTRNLPSRVSTWAEFTEKVPYSQFAYDFYSCHLTSDAKMAVIVAEEGKAGLASICSKLYRALYYAMKNGPDAMGLDRPVKQPEVALTVK